MRGLLVMYRKELEDHFSSTRFILLLTVILMVSLLITYMVGTGIREALEGSAKPSLVFLLLFTVPGKLFSLAQFIAFFGPLIGMVLGFDAISRERSSRTLSKLISQPIYRDAVINGKFLAGLTIISLMLLSITLLISGMGLWVLGVVPGGEEVGRLAVYLVVSIVYIGFWLAVSILFSILFRGMATSALAALALWIFLAFFMPLGSSVVADAVRPLPSESSSNYFDARVGHDELQHTLVLLSPITLYNEATGTILNPMQKTNEPLSALYLRLGPMERLSLSRFQNPLPLLQSALIVMPHLISLVAITVVCFTICYACFMRQEVRST